MISALLDFHRGALEQGTSIQSTLLEVFSHEQSKTEVQIASGLNKLGFQLSTLNNISRHKFRFILFHY